MKGDRAARDHRRHSSHSAKEKVEWNLPSPDRRFHYWLPIIASTLRNRATRNINTAISDNAFVPSLLPQFVEAFFGIHRHEENANAANVAIIDAIAVANADAQADFK